ncbi:MAG TPA: zf-HC2 domain-containing protein [Bacteroidota bacterium]|nr:zf-HC2 domain-containing protein [Bacteroidota bacterium]
MKRCKYQPLVSALLDDEVSVQERVVAEEHLQRCVECQQFFSVAQETRAKIQELGTLESEPSQIRRIMDEVWNVRQEYFAWQRIEIPLKHAVVVLTLFVVMVISLFLVNEPQTNRTERPLVAISDSTFSVISILTHDISNQDIAYAAMMSSK